MDQPKSVGKVNRNEWLNNRWMQRFPLIRSGLENWEVGGSAVWRDMRTAAHLSLFDDYAHDPHHEAEPTKLWSRSTRMSTLSRSSCRELSHPYRISRLIALLFGLSSATLRSCPWIYQETTLETRVWHTSIKYWLRIATSKNTYVRLSDSFDWIWRVEWFSSCRIFPTIISVLMASPNWQRWFPHALNWKISP